jgi:hypothetical protein
MRHRAMLTRQRHFSRSLPLVAEAISEGNFTGGGIGDHSKNPKPKKKT